MVRHLSAEWIEALDAALMSCVFDPDIRLVIQHVVDGTEYFVAVTDGRAAAEAGRTGSPTVTFTSDRATASAIATGRLSAQQAFTSGRLLVRGDLAALVRSQDVVDRLDRVTAVVRDQTEFSDA